MSFERYVTVHRVPLLRFAGTLTGDRTLAEDLVHDVLVRACPRWGTIGALEHPHAYVRRMVVNEFLGWRRRRHRLEFRAQIELDDLTADPSTTHAERAALDAELRRLPRRQRVVLAMRYFEDLPDTEIAIALGCSAATVRSIASRALARLRIQLTDAQDPDEPHDLPGLTSATRTKKERSR